MAARPSASRRRRRLRDGANPPIRGHAAALHHGHPNRFAAAALAALLLASSAAMACGTRAPAVQAKIDAQELARIRQLAHAHARESDEIYIGTVTGLVRAAPGSPDPGSVTFAVRDTLKGAPSSTRSARWKESGVISCRPSAMFGNVGFRHAGTFIVYVRGGIVTRSQAADELRSGLFTLDEERALVASLGSH